jgi:glycosyltransferase involved in cell wall biosynthesis
VFDDAGLGGQNSDLNLFWKNVLLALAELALNEIGDLDIVVLNRTNRLNIAGLRSASFPSLPSYLPYFALDRSLVAKACASLKADVYISSYFGFAPGTPSLQAAFETLPTTNRPEDLSDHRLEEKLSRLAADQVVVASERDYRNSESLDEMPKIAGLSFVRSGIDTRIFCGRSTSEIKSFREDVKIHGEYVVIVGDRYPTAENSHVSAFFESLALMESSDFGIVVLDGEPLSDLEKFVCGSLGIRLIRITLQDDDLAVCYAGAAAVVQLSLTTGRRNAPVEALSCGTPVICLSSAFRSPLADPYLLIVVGEASAANIHSLLVDARSTLWRAKIKEFQKIVTDQFSWKSTARDVLDAAQRAIDNFESPTQRAKRDFIAEYDQHALVQQRG